MHTEETCHDLPVKGLDVLQNRITLRKSSQAQILRNLFHLEYTFHLSHRSVILHRSPHFTDVLCVNFQNDLATEN